MEMRGFLLRNLAVDGGLFYMLQVWQHFFLECVAKGSRLTLEVWGWETCSPSVAGTTAPRPQFARPRHWAALSKCDQDDMLEVDFLTNSVLLLCFLACVEVAFEFCVAGVEVRKLLEKSLYKITSK